MCDKCKENKEFAKEFANTRYCDDWWDTTDHKGNNGDREFQDEWEQQEEQNSSIPSIAE